MKKINEPGHYQTNDTMWTETINNNLMENEEMSMKNDEIFFRTDA